MIITIDDINGILEPEDYIYSYQIKLTNKLDRIKTITKNNSNEIVLWKINRYINLDNKSMSLINSISKSSNRLNKKLTVKVLENLLAIKGMRLPIASTFLRFRNPKIYQIIDKRVYRFIYRKKLNISSPKTFENIDNQIKLYLDYLTDLKIICRQYNIKFRDVDRILYNADKRINKGERIDY